MIYAILEIDQVPICKYRAETKMQLVELVARHYEVADADITIKMDGDGRFDVDISRPGPGSPEIELHIFHGENAHGDMDYYTNARWRGDDGQRKWLDTEMARLDRWQG